MHEAAKRYLPGIEFYMAPGMGLCGVQNDARGNQRTAQYLDPNEASEWLVAFIKGEEWRRSATASVSNQDTKAGE